MRRIRRISVGRFFLWCRRSRWIWPQLALGGGFECVVIMTNGSTDLSSIVDLGLKQGNDEAWSGEWTANGEDGNDIDSLSDSPAREAEDPSRQRFRFEEGLSRNTW